MPHPVFGPAISELFARAATGQHGDSELARWMAERAPRATGAPWQPSEVRRWLSTRTYLGEVAYGNLPVNTEAHEPLTNPDTWKRCQREPGMQRRARSRFLLAGLVRCASCRYAMSGLTHGGAKASTPVYRCSRGRNGGCDAPSVITASTVEEYVKDKVLGALRGLELEAAGAGVDLEAADREYEEAEAELQAFGSDLNARKLLGEAGWQAGLSARADDRDAKREARDRAYAESRLVTLARDVHDLDHEALRDLIAGMARYVFVRKRPRGAAVADRVFIVWADDTRLIDVPGPHRSGPFEPVRW